MESDDKNNPWSVSKLEEFLYFCCPECDLKDQSKEAFVQHALDHHPKSKDAIQSIYIKEEPINENDHKPEVLITDGVEKITGEENITGDEDLPNDDFYEGYEVKCEIKEEDDEDYFEEDGMRFFRTGKFLQLIFSS